MKPLLSATTYFNTGHIEATQKEATLKGSFYFKKKLMLISAV